MEKEIWKDIKGYEGLYKISNFGNIISFHKGKITILNLKKRINKSRGNKFGYYRCSLYKDGNTKNFYVHKLVALSFIPNPENKKYIDHINGNSLDNNVNNLRWCTVSENNRNPISRGRWFLSFGKKAPKIIRKADEKIFLSYTDVSEILCENPENISRKLKKNGEYKGYFLFEGK